MVARCAAMTFCKPSSLPFAPLTELIIEGFHDCVHELGCGFGEAVIVEVKATRRIEDVGRAQLLNYLKCAGGGVGLLANFGLRPEIKRFVMGDPMNSLPRLSKAPVRNIERWIPRPSSGQESTAEPC